MKTFKDRKSDKIKNEMIFNIKKSKAELIENEILRLKEEHEKLGSLDISKLNSFTALPLSKNTLEALAASKFVKPTEIQRLTLIPALQGRDVLAEAKTGSGKTLAFLIPLAERMLLDKISVLDGPVAIILTPTRELARQICIVLVGLAKYHDFTVVDIMGGKNKVLAKSEWDSVASGNVLVGTPGRMAQHQNENPNLEMGAVRMLILDEADRLLEAGFHWEIQAVLDNMPPNCQTLLFSATQTKSVRQLVRLSLKSPATVSVSKADRTTPDQLREKYVKVELHKKLDYLYTFLTSHCKKKIIVFFSTQKQVRFVYELFRNFRLYFTVLQLRGNMKQDKRFEVYDKFSRKEHGAVLLCTNIAERGLDFPHVDWVVQFDCPKDINDYVHRVGRTARFESDGRAILFLLPSELPLLPLLEQQKHITIKETSFPEGRMRSLRDQASSLLAERPELKWAGQLAVAAFLKDYCLCTSSKASGMGTVFKPDQLSVLEYAKSMGLADIPPLDSKVSARLKLPLQTISVTPGKSRTLLLSEEKSDTESEDDLFQLKEATTTTEKSILESKMEESDSENSDDSATQLKKSKAIVTKAKIAKKLLKKGLKTHTKIQFDQEGDAVVREVGGVALTTTAEEDQVGGLDLARERERMREVDKSDKEAFKERLKKDRLKVKLKTKKKQKKDINEVDEVEYRLESGSEEEDASDDNASAQQSGEEMESSIDHESENEDDERDDTVSGDASEEDKPITSKNSEKLHSSKRKRRLSNDSDADYDLKRVNLNSLESAALKLLE